MEIRSLSHTQTRGSADAELPLPVPRVPDLSGRILGARYSLRRRIGGGSMGTVYEARDMTLGTAVAVKVMHPEYSDDETFRKRFHQEALIGARLRHEHSVAVTDLGQSDDGLLFSVMEFLEGESLDALLSSSSTPLPWRRVVLIAFQVCAALQAAHDRGIIHRDIKPGNCFLVRREGRAVADDDIAGGFTFIKVLDLGLARVMPVSGRPTPPGRLGAPEYLAPEQIQGSICDHRVDLYALGVMMFELLTRRMPFMGETPSATMRAHLESPPPSLRRVAPDAEIPASLEAVIQRALAKDPAERYASATEMAWAIQAAASEGESEAAAAVVAAPAPTHDEDLDDDDELEPPVVSAAAHSSAAMSSPAGVSGPSSASWRHPPPTIPTLNAVSAMTTLTSMVLAPDYGYGPSIRGGLAVLALAFTGICVAVTALWTSNRLLLVPEAEANPTIEARPAQQAPAPVTPPRRRPIDTAPLGPVEPVAIPEEVVDLSGPPWADPELPGESVLLAADDPPSNPPPNLPRRSGERRAPPPPGAFLPSSERTPGVPLERTFRRLAESVAPGVHRCMRMHSADLTELTVELTVGGPRRTAVELGLKGADTPALRACLAPLLARIDFPATERTARYAVTYKP
jgi:serine/threonine protein kinase